MWKALYDVYLDGDCSGCYLERIAAKMSLRDATLFMRAYMEEYYNDTSFSLVLRHSPLEDTNVGTQEN